MHVAAPARGVHCRAIAGVGGRMASNPTAVSPYITINNNNPSSMHLAISRRPLVTEAVQSGLHGLHAYSGLPWYQTFALSTVLVRLGLFPLAVIQIHNIKQAALAMPMMREAFRLYRSKVADRTIATADKVRASRLYFGNLLLPLTIHGASASKIVGCTAFSVGTFMAFMYSVRAIAESDYAVMSKESFFWIASMTERDPTSVLPFLAISLTYIAIGIRSSGGERPAAASGLQDLLQTFVILGTPYSVM